MFRQNHLFQSILGSKAMLQNFQSVKCLHKLVEPYDGRNSGVKTQKSKKGIKKNGHEFFWFLIPLPVSL